MSSLPTILNIHKDAAVRAAISSALEKSGLPSSEAASLEAHRGARPDAVVVGAGEWQSMANALRERKLDIERLQKQRDEIRARLARELREPLGAINTSLEALAARGAPDAVDARLREVVGHQLARLTEIIDDLLEGSGRAPPEVLRGQAPPATVKLRILVIEDQKDARDALGALLTIWGHEVHMAADGLEGIAMAKAKKPEVALVDLGLPNVDGFEVARALRSTFVGRPLRIIALTGSARPQDREHAKQAGFDAHLSKPVDARELSQALMEPAWR